MNSIIIGLVTMYTYLEVLKLIVMKYFFNKTKVNSLTIVFFLLKSVFLWMIFAVYIVNQYSPLYILIGAFLGKTIFCLRLYFKLKDNHLKPSQFI